MMDDCKSERNTLDPKRRKVEDSSPWILAGGMYLTMNDKEVILSGLEVRTE